VKSQEEIQRRLEKLRLRYLKRHCAAAMGRRPHNCTFNHEHTPTQRKPDVPTEMELAPRMTTSLVVIQPDSPVRLCMYGSEDPAAWNGDICDRDDMARQCKWFQPRVTEQQAIDEFGALMADDDYVYENHKDVAALQWVLDERVARVPLSWWDRLLLWIDGFARRFARPKRLPQAPDEPVPGGLWTDADAEDPGKRPAQIQE